MFSFRQRKSTARRYFPSANPDPEKQLLLEEYKAQQLPSPRYLTIQSGYDASVLNEIKTDQTIMSLDCSGLNESELVSMLEAASENPAIHSFNFKKCDFSADAKNLLSGILKHRLIKKLGFEACGFEAFDVDWLKVLVTYIYAAEQITIAENLDAQHFREIYPDFPLSNLNTIGARACNLRDISHKIYASQHLHCLRIISDAPLTCEQVGFLFEVICLAEIDSLEMMPCTFEDEHTQKMFFNLLRSNTQLREFKTDYSLKAAEAVFATLASENTYLSAVSFLNAPITVIGEKINELSARNALINQGRALLVKTTDPEEEEDDKVLKANDLIDRLSAYLIPGYISTSQEDVVSLIKSLQQLVQESHEDTKEIIFSPTLRRRRFGRG